MEVSDNASASGAKFSAGLVCPPLVEFQILDLDWFGWVRLLDLGGFGWVWISLTEFGC